MQATDDLKAASSNAAELHERAELMGLNLAQGAAVQRHRNLEVSVLGSIGRVV